MIFIDSACLKDIEWALARGFPGVTTNPSILAKEEKIGFEKHIGEIVSLIKRHNPDAHLSVEVFSQDSEVILKQAKQFKKDFDLKNLSIKIPVGDNELAVINRLHQEGVSVNCTCCMSVSQAVLAANAGAEYVSLFWGRIRDGGKNTNDVDTNGRKAMQDKNGLVQAEEDDFCPHAVMEDTRMIFDREYPATKIIAGSIRSVRDVIDAMRSGAHIVTVPPKFSPGMVTHFKTDEVVGQFMNDFKKWLS